jgi:alkylation response protein AidB-like acyl-CoA dehydrogenase
MDFELTDEQKAFRDSVKDFARRELTDGALERAHSSDYPWDVATRLGALGLLGITVDEADGGGGGSLMDAVLAIEQIAAVCPRSADVIQAGNFGAIRVLAQFGSPSQKARYLKPLLQGDGLICVAMTEPDAGSAATELTTTATPDGDGFRINGSKIFTTHGLHASVFLVYVRFGPGIDGIGSVLIERGTEGFTFGAPSSFLGGEDWNPLFFDDVYVPAENVLLGPGGFKSQMSGFNVERIGNSARALALGRYSFEFAREHALTRHQFGRPLAEFQGLQWKFAEMKAKLDAAQLLLYRAAVNADHGFPSPEETAIAKLVCNRAGFEIANESLQVLGGLGYSTETLVEYCLRRTRGWMIAGGTIEMLLNRIAESVFDRRFSQRAKA